ncbi:MAG: DEAD/DEAH box helicase [Syntrophales bacterium]|nr:DEAD/DEAH box helicase [Syntrophales bacterium]
MSELFSIFGLHPELMQAIAEVGYRNPTSIQSAVIPAMMAGHDVIGRSQTGTGKTAAFSLPLLHAVAAKKSHVQGLVVTPTRELALQVTQAIQQLGKYRGIRVLAVYGGQAYGVQLKGLRKGAHIIAGTPGRIIDLVRKEALDLGRLDTVVLDEADEMLGMGFIDDIVTILDKAPPARQTALFSATMPPEIRRLAERYLRTPEICAVEQRQVTVSAVEQRYYIVHQKDKVAALSRLLEVEEIKSALIFARTRIGTAELVGELAGRGFSSEALNGDMSQDAREGVLDRFRQNKMKVLVATDVAARGLDIDDISHVINYDLPGDPEAYVHRIGRTARAGRSGIAISLATPKDIWFLRKVEGFIKQNITRSVLPTPEAIEERRGAQLLDKVMVWLKRDRCRRERKIAEDLMKEGFDPLEIAAAALRLARSNEKQRPVESLNSIEEEIAGRKERMAGNHVKNSGGKVAKGEPAHRKRAFREVSPERGMVRFVLKKGKADGIHVGAVLDTFARNSKIPGSSIGKISIRDRCTYVDIPERFAGQVLAKAAHYRMGAQSVAVERA